LLPRCDPGSTWVARRNTSVGTDDVTGTACILPSGLSPSVPEFHQVNRSVHKCTDRVADYHRRLGLSPTPEHVCSTGYCAITARAHASVVRVRRRGRTVRPGGVGPRSPRSGLRTDRPRIRPRTCSLLHPLPERWCGGTLRHPPAPRCPSRPR